jgi:high-affinity iron transporter
MTDAVVIVLREVLEAMLLICMLMASSTALGYRFRWMVLALVLGVCGAIAYALRLEQISMAFDGFGQEIVNSALLISIAVLLATHNYFAVRQLNDLSYRMPYRLMFGLFVGAVGMAMTREGAEIYLYGYSYGVMAGNMSSVFSGGAIGLGIGLSMGTFFYYVLKSLPRKQRLITCCAVSLVLAAGMMGQVALYLSQADILPSQQPLWDTSNVFAESSLIGELLRGAIGYEASPTLIQVLLYMGSILTSTVAMIAAWLLYRKSANTVLGDAQ